MAGLSFSSISALVANFEEARYAAALHAIMRWNAQQATTASGSSLVTARVSKHMRTFLDTRGAQTAGLDRLHADPFGRRV